MGKIVISANATLDGVVQDPDGSEGFERGGWFHRFGGPDLTEWAARETAELVAADALLLGGRSGEWFATNTPAPDSGEVRVSPEFVARMHSIPKYIVSSSFEASRWNNTKVIKGDVAQQISALKEEIDGEIVIYGSYQLVRTLIAHNLADELRLVSFPVMVGTGERILDKISDAASLRLVEARKLGKDMVFQAYVLNH